MKLFHSSEPGGGNVLRDHCDEQNDAAALPVPRAMGAADELQWHMHRHFDPTQGQWIEEEPIAFADLDAALRPYVDRKLGDAEE